MGDGLREGCGAEPCLALAVLLVLMVVVERSDAGEAADVLCIIGPAELRAPLEPLEFFVWN
jgi:hypothetical protein